MIKLTIYNLSVQLQTDDYLLQAHIHTFLDRFYTIRQQAFGNKGIEQIKVFVGKIKDQGIYLLHTTQFIHLYQYLKEINYPLSVTDKIDKRDYFIASTDFKIRDHWQLRDDQKPIVEFLTTNPFKSKLIPIATGRGKTLCGMYAIGLLKKRLAIVILARFAEKWIEDVAKIHEAKIKDVMLIKGSKHLRAIIELAKEGAIDNNYFVFSAETLQNYITAYELNPEETIEYYGCSPMELFPLLGIGIMLNDETHMSFHLIYKILIYSNIEYQIGLSATLLSDDHTTRRMHRIVYPEECVYQDNIVDKYVDIFPIAYSINDRYNKFIKTTNYGSSSYSHIAFEQSITRKDFTRDIYYKIINSVIQDYYIAHYKEKDKVIIFIATIKFATELTAYLKNTYPDKDVRRYCDDDPYEDLMAAEIIVTTVLSAGTNVDIPNLRVGIQTVSISSPSSNLQSLGRLRKLPDRDVKFCYLYSDNLPKQKAYHLRRMELFKEKAASIQLRRSRVNFF